MSMGKPQHPHLYFSAEELPELRRRARTGVRAEVLARLVAWCERLLDPNDIARFDYADFAQPHWRERHSIFQLTPSLIALAFGYAFTGERRYGEAASDAVGSVIDHGLADSKARAYGGATVGWRHGMGHDKSLYAWAMCTAWDLCHEFFTQSGRRQFCDHALESIDLFPYDSVQFREDNNQLLNNRGARGQVGVFGYYPLALAGDVEVPDADKHLRYAVAAAEIYLHMTFEQDGVCYDGPAYAGALEQLTYFCHMLPRHGQPNILRSSRWENYLHHLAHEVLPGGYTLNNLNDCHSPCGTVVPSLFLMGQKNAAGQEKAPLLPWLARQLDLHPRRVAEATDDGCGPHGAVGECISGPNAPAFLLHWDDDVPLRTPEELGYPQSRRFPQRGIASMRSGWAADDTLLSHRCGSEIWRLHKQSDQNHLALYALGERFLVDEGYGQGDISGMADGRSQVVRYFGCADVHNTVLIDGRDQNGNQQTPGWAEGRLIDWQHSGEFDSTLGDASQAYGFDHAIDSALRRVVFVKDATQPFIVVIDTIQVNDDDTVHDYTALWRTAKTNSIEVDSVLFRIVGDANDCHGAVLHPPDVALTVREHYRLPQLMVTARGPLLEMVTVLAPVRRGDAVPTFTCERTAAGDFAVRAGSGRTVTAGTRTAGPLRKAAAVVIL